MVWDELVVWDDLTISSHSRISSGVKIWMVMGSLLSSVDVIEFLGGLGFNVGIAVEVV